MISNNKHTLLFWTWLTLVTGDSMDQRKHLTNELYKSVFSEKEIFFNPANKEPVPLLSLSSSTKIRGPKGVYGWLPCFCGPEGCSCCVDIRIKSLNSEDSGCVMISPTHDNSSMNAEILLNNKTMVQERLSCTFSQSRSHIFMFLLFGDVLLLSESCCFSAAYCNIGFRIQFLWYTERNLERVLPTPNLCMDTGQGDCYSIAALVDGICYLPTQTISKYDTRRYRTRQHHISLVFDSPNADLSIEFVDDPSPLCSPFPRLPFIAGCVKFNRIRTDNGHLRGCAKLEVRVTGTDAILWDMQFSCFKIGTDGIMFSNPNKKPKPIKETKPIKKPNEECH